MTSKFGKQQVIWGLAGFAFVVLVSAVAWLGVIVSDLRSEIRGGVDVLEVSAAPAEAPPMPDPKRPKLDPRPRLQPMAAKKGAPSLAPPASRKPAPRRTSKVQATVTTAGDLGIEHLPADMEMVVSMPGDDAPDIDGGGPLGEGGGPSGLDADDPYVQEGYPPKNNEVEHLDKLKTLFPDINARLTPDDEAAFHTDVRRRFRPEAALMAAVLQRANEGQLREIMPRMAAAIERKWERVEAQGGAGITDEAIAAIDEQLTDELEALLPPRIMDNFNRAMEGESAFNEVPEGEELQKIAWVVKSLKTKGLKETLMETDRMKVEAYMPPPPPGISADDPEYLEATRRRRMEALQEHPDDKGPPTNISRNPKDKPPVPAKP